MTVFIIITLYFVIVLLIGIYSSLRIKSTKDYYVAGKKAGFWQLSGSLFATIVGSSAILGTIEMGQKTGWPAVWFLLCGSAGLFLLLPLAKKVQATGKYTLPEMLGRFYGKPAEKMASLVIPVAWTGVVAAQVIGAAKIMDGLDFITYQNGAILSGVVFIIYTLIGGQISILKTDLFQAILIIAGVAVILAAAMRNPLSIQITPFSPSELFNSKFGFFDLMVLFFTYSVTFVVGPDIYSRLFCTDNEKTAHKTVFAVALVLAPMAFSLTYLGLYSHQLNNEKIMAFAAHILPEWGYALFVAALLSAVMSSAATTLLSSSTILAGLFNKDLDHKKSLAATRIFIVIIGVVSVFISLRVTSVINALLFALSFFSGAFVAPMLAGLLELNVSKRRVVPAIIAGGITALAGKLISAYVNSMMGNLLIIFSFILNSAILFLPFGKTKPDNH